MFVHTHVPALLLGRWMRRIPHASCRSMPPRSSSTGSGFTTRTTGRTSWSSATRSERRSGASSAVAIVVWSQWVSDSLVSDYGLDPANITVVGPGVNIELWERNDVGSNDAGLDDAGLDDSVLRVLFVGGDLHRKGAPALTEAARRLRTDASVPPFEVHLVTTGRVDPEPGVIVHDDMKPNSPELRALYHSSQRLLSAHPGRLLADGALRSGCRRFGRHRHRCRCHSRYRGARTRPVSWSSPAMSMRSRWRFDECSPSPSCGNGSAAPPRSSCAHGSMLGQMRCDSVILSRPPRGRLDVTEPAVGSARRRVLLTVSGVVPQGLADAVASGSRPVPTTSRWPRPSTPICSTTPRRSTTRAHRHGSSNECSAKHRVGVVLLPPRHPYDVIMTDGEQVGLPSLCSPGCSGRRGSPRDDRAHPVGPEEGAARPRCVGSPVKSTLRRVLTRQRVLRDRVLGCRTTTSCLSTFMVDTEFFAPGHGRRRARRLICSAGLERRDYPTLVEAVDGLDVES